MQTSCRSEAAEREGNNLQRQELSAACGRGRRTRDASLGQRPFGLLKLRNWHFPPLQVSQLDWTYCISKDSGSNSFYSVMYIVLRNRFLEFSY